MMSQVYEGGVNDSTPTGMGKVTAIGQRADGIYLFQNEAVIESYLQMLGVLNGWCGIIYSILSSGHWKRKISVNNNVKEYIKI